ncbi:isoleucine N-monooxygenase 2-like, partial [Papaver somniferum]|uniref:isoleucine N-monooxygenase 2-like n=1 Tax=Papaver somniferum TaxID=3469 RepID=UPI000E6FD7C8
HDVSTSFPLPLGPSPWPILDSIPDLLRNKPSFKWILGFMNKINIEIACIRLGHVHVIPVTSPEIAREFLKKQDVIFASRPITMATEYSSRGFLIVVITPWGEQWKKMIRVVTSEMVSHARLKWLLQKRNEEADNLVFYLHNKCNKNSLNGGQVFNLRLLTRQFSGHVIRKMIFNKMYFGKDRKDGGPCIEEIEHVNSAFIVLYYINSFGIQDYLPYLRWLDLDGHEKIVKRAMGVVNKYHDPIIEERIQQWSNGGMENKLPEDLLDVLISLKDEHGNRPNLKEVDLGFYSNSGTALRPADILVHNLDNGRDICFDVTGVSPFTRSGVRNFSHGIAIKNVVSKRSDMYLEKCTTQGFGFGALVFTTLGELGDDFTELLKRLRRYIASYDVNVRVENFSFID